MRLCKMGVYGYEQFLMHHIHPFISFEVFGLVVGVELTNLDYLILPLRIL